MSSIWKPVARRAKESREAPREARWRQSAYQLSPSPCSSCTVPSPLAIQIVVPSENRPAELEDPSPEVITAAPVETLVRKPVISTKEMVQYASVATNPFKR